MTPAIDVWSVGIVMAILLNDCTHPFVSKGEPDEKIQENILNNRLNLHKIQCSSKAMDLVKRLLETSSSKRITAVEALAHPWFSTKAVSAAIDFSHRRSHSYVENLRSCKSQKEKLRRGLKLLILLRFLTSRSSWETQPKRNNFMQRTRTPINNLTQLNFRSSEPENKTCKDRPSTKDFNAKYKINIQKSRGHQRVNSVNPIRKESLDTNFSDEKRTTGLRLNAARVTEGAEIFRVTTKGMRVSSTTKASIPNDSQLTALNNSGNISQNFIQGKMSREIRLSTEQPRNLTSHGRAISPAKEVNLTKLLDKVQEGNKLEAQITSKVQQMYMLKPRYMGSAKKNGRAEISRGRIV